MSNYLKRWGSLLLLGYLFLSLLQLPTVLVKNEHDLGSQAAYEYWLVNGFQYGIDFLQNVGPYGFLNYPLLYSGFLFYIKIFLNIFLVFSLLYLTPKPSFKVFLIYILSLMLYNKQDVFIYILLHVSFIHILQPTTKQKCVLSLFITALLCLAKSTCLFVTLWGAIVLVLKSHIYREKYINKILLFFLFLISLWFIAGQPINGFYYYVIGAVIFSNGYNEAMAVQEPLFVTFSAIFVGFYFLLQLYRKLLITDQRLKIGLVLDSLFFVFLLFATWKHGIIRGDQVHISIFFAYSIFAICMQHLSLHFEPISIPPESEKTPSALPAVILLSSFFLILPSNATLDKYIFHNFSNAFNNLMFLINIQGHKNALDQQLIYFKNNIRLPEFEKIIYGKKVGYLGIKPAVMLYNKLNYLTNPSTISFAAWNPSIMKADSVFFTNQVDYLIVELETIDKRYLPLDSSLSKLEILKGFNFFASNNSYVLLKKKESQKTITFLHVESDFPYILGSWRTIPNKNDFTWVKINLMSNFVETILSILYKPMSYQIEFNFGNGKVNSYRYIPALGKQGFLLSPEIFNNKDLVSHLTNSSVNTERPVEFRIICKGPNFLCKEKGSVQFSNVVGL